MILMRTRNTNVSPDSAVALLSGTLVATAILMGGVLLAMSPSSGNWADRIETMVTTPLVGFAVAASIIGLIVMRRALVSPVAGIGSGRRIALVAAACAVALVGNNLTGSGDATAQDVTYAPGEVLVASDDLNLRTDAAVEADVVDTIPAGMAVTVTSDPISDGTYTWYGVTSDLGDGFVVSDYLVDPAVIATGTSVSITTDALNLRDAAGFESSVVTTLDSGTEITISGDPTVLDGITWYPVESASGSGWAAGEYLAAI